MHALNNLPKISLAAIKGSKTIKMVETSHLYHHLMQSRFLKIKVPIVILVCETNGYYHIYYTVDHRHLPYKENFCLCLYENYFTRVKTGYNYEGQLN